MRETFSQRSGIGSPAAGSALGAILQAGELNKTDNPYPLPQKPMRVYGLYAVVYVLAGGGGYEDSNGHTQTVEAGDLILVLPTLGHRYGPLVGQSWHEVYLVFSGPVFELWEQQGLLDPRRPVRRLEPIDYWFNRLNSVIRPDAPANANEAATEVCRLQSVLSEALLEERVAGEDSDERRWLMRASALLETDASLERVAEQMTMSYPHFRRRFRKLSDRSPGRYRAERQIERACALMQQRDRPDKAIAAELGFCDEFHFSRRFKQITGLSPSQYRRSLP